MTVRQTLNRWLDRFFNRLSSLPTLEAEREMRRAVTETIDDTLGSFEREARLRVVTETYRSMNADERMRAMTEQRDVKWHCDSEPCPECAAYCSSSFGPTALVPDIPVHPNCKCVLLGRVSMNL